MLPLIPLQGSSSTEALEMCLRECRFYAYNLFSARPSLNVLHHLASNSCIRGTRLLQYICSGYM